MAKTKPRMGDLVTPLHSVKPAGWADEGVKADDGKLPYHLVPGDALEEIIKVLDFGAKKYAAENWRKGMKWSRVWGAVMRHLWAWWRGQDKDPETGLSHLAHAGCGIFFLIWFELHKVGTDDRFKKDWRALLPESSDGGTRPMRRSLPIVEERAPQRLTAARRYVRRAKDRATPTVR